MKKILLFVAVVFTGLNGFSQKPLFADQPKDSVVHLDPRMQQFDYVPGEILIRYKDDVQVQNLKTGNIVQTGLATIDSLFFRYRISDQQKLFPAEQKLKSKVMLRSFNGKEFEKPSLHNIYKLTLPQESNMFQAIEELKKDSNIVYAEPNYILSITHDKAVSPPMTEKDLEKFAAGKLPGISNTSPFPLPGAHYPVTLPVNPPDPKSTPNDPLYPQQWYIPAVHADAVWDSVQGKDTTQVIAILDTGIDWLHPDLSPNVWINPGEIPGNGVDDDGNGYTDDVRGWDFVNNDNNPMDDNGHGTHVAGIAAARGNNSIGISGISPRAKIMALKVFQANGYGNAATIAQGINYAAAAGATILNMSFGSYGRSFTMETALQNAYLTAVLVAAAGNDHKSIYSSNPMDPTLFYPAGLPYVLGVQANADFSNYDPDGPIYSAYADGFNYELTAPGSELLSTFRNGTYKNLSGTSMAAPCVSGAVALYRAFYPARSNEELWGDLIHTSSGIINIQQAMFNTIKYPVFDLLATTVVDTLAGDDRDGQADAGETIQLWIKIRNTFGPADSAFVKLQPNLYGDTASVQILNDSTYLGGIGTWATITNQPQPFTVFIKPSAINDQTVQLDVVMKNIGDTAEYIQTISFKVYNGTELSGLLSQDITLTPDRLWLINNSLRISTGVTMTILPGTQVHVNAGVDNRGLVYAVGTPDSLVRIKGAIGGACQYANVDFNLNGSGLSTSGTVTNCHIASGAGVQAGKIVNCMIENISDLNTGSWIRADSMIGTAFHNIVVSGNFEGRVIRCTLDNLIFFFTMSIPSMKYSVCSKIVNLYKYLYPNFPNLWQPSFLLSVNDDEAYVKNTFIANEYLSYFVKTEGGSDAIDFTQQYWGTTDTLKIRQKYYDFWKDAGLPLLICNPFLISPSDSCPGHVWKVLVNGIDAQDGTPDPVGVGNAHFQVFFNRPMDTTFPPNLSFGVRQPYTQNAVADSAGWSADRKEWHAVFPVQLFTGDGLQQIRVAGARDPDGMEIPVEDTRFRFNIQAAGSASIDFTAQPLIGKIYLEWNNARISDLLGFNLYRFRNLTDTTFTSPERINSELITDTTFTDFDVIPGQHYWYYYKVVNTDFREADSSKFVNAVPYNAAVGDANGDESVNVLDIMTVIAYMLGQDPQPFLFDAADVNKDQSINILDVIGIVNRTLNPEKSGFDNTGTNPVPAYIRLENDRIIFTSEGQVASLQFELTGEGLDKIHLTEPPAGFELAYGIVNGKLLGILYSSTNRNIPAGTIDLVKLRDASVTPEWDTILAGDALSNRVPVLKETPAVTAKPEMYLQAYPNPFSQKVTINFRLIENAKVKISVYTMNGRIVNILTDKFLKDGLYWIDWNGTSFNNRTVPSGIYLCRLEGVTPEGIQFKKETKIVFIR